jgi:hypothetical protein
MGQFCDLSHGLSGYVKVLHLVSTLSVFGCGFCYCGRNLFGIFGVLNITTSVIAFFDIGYVCCAFI